MVQTLKDNLTILQKERLKWKPEVPFELCNLKRISLDYGKIKPLQHSIVDLFPQISLLPSMTCSEGSLRSCKPHRMGVLFSGGQAPGGHNVVCGLLDGLLAMNSESVLLGFLEGPKGLIEGNYQELDLEKLKNYRNQGGFDLLGSGRDKIESPEQFEKAKQVVLKEKLDGLLIVGGDDSNTNAAFLAEYFAKEKVGCAVIGVPKTIDGDLQSSYIEIPFGFDTACKTYEALIGDICRDILSAKKYYAFIRLMGRSASHIALECALSTHPNLTLISEEKKSLSDVVAEITQLIQDRANLGKNYGVILIPEGLVEAIPDLTKVMHDLDPHGNLKVSQIETERLLIDLVKKEVDPSIKFASLPFFLGYEGRAAMPSNFDANYCYALGVASSLAIDFRLNGVISTLQGLDRAPQEWTMTFVPLAQMLDFEMKKGVNKAVIKKTLVDLKGKVYLKYLNESDKWRLTDEYVYRGPIQFFGPKELTDSPVETIKIR